MAVIKYFIISCSEDINGPEPCYFVFGESASHTLPKDREEIESRLTVCQEKNKCKICDAQIHHVNLVRTHKAGTAYDDAQRRRLTKK